MGRGIFLYIFYLCRQVLIIVLVADFFSISFICPLLTLLERDVKEYLIVDIKSKLFPEEKHAFEYHYRVLVDGILFNGIVFVRVYVQQSQSGGQAAFFTDWFKQLFSDKVDIKAFIIVVFRLVFSGITDFSWIVEIIKAD